MYHDNFILGQLIVAANQPAQTETYSCKENEVKLIFFSYGFDLDKSSVLYSTSKQKNSDAFISTSFRKHYSEIIYDRRERKRKEFSTLFYYLPSITDRKETINLHKNNANLTPIYCPLMLIESFASKKGTSFNPQLLNSTNPEHRNPQVEMLYGLFRQIAEYSNNNLVRNADYLLAKNKRRAEDMLWVVVNKKRFDLTMFKLTY